MGICFLLSEARWGTFARPRPAVKHSGCLVAGVHDAEGVTYELGPARLVRYEDDKDKEPSKGCEGQAPDHVIKKVFGRPINGVSS